MCVPVRRVATARRVNLGGEGNALYPILSSCCFASVPNVRIHWGQAKTFHILLDTFTHQVFLRRPLCSWVPSSLLLNQNADKKLLKWYNTEEEEQEEQEEQDEEEQDEEEQDEEDEEDEDDEEDDDDDGDGDDEDEDERRRRCRQDNAQNTVPCKKPHLYT